MGYFFHVAKIQASGLRSRIEFRKTQRVSMFFIKTKKPFHSCSGTTENPNGCCLHCKIYPEI
jgi:hypothetical protein